MAIVAERLARPAALLEMHQEPRKNRTMSCAARGPSVQNSADGPGRGRRRRGRTCRRCGRRFRRRSGRAGRSRWGSRSCGRSTAHLPGRASSSRLPARRGCRAATAPPRKGPGRTSGSPGTPCSAFARWCAAPAAERRVRPAPVPGPAGRRRPGCTAARPGSASAAIPDENAPQWPAGRSGAAAIPRP